MKYTSLAFLLSTVVSVFGQTETTIKSSVIKQIESYAHYSIKMEEWFKFQSKNDTFYRLVDTEVSSILSQPAYTRSTIIDQFDTTYQVATGIAYTSLSLRNNTYTYFEKKKEKNILYQEYIKRGLYLPLNYKSSFIKAFRLLPDTNKIFYILRHQEKFGSLQDSTTFIKLLYISKSDYMPMILEDWAYFEDGVQYTKQKLLYAEKWNKKDRFKFINSLDSSSNAYRTHLNGDSLLKIHYLKYKTHQLGDTMNSISGRVSLSHDSINLFSNGDSILVIDFSYTNCGPCINGIPSLNNLHQQYDSLGVGVFWVDPYSQDWPRIEKFTNYYKVKFPIIEVSYDYIYDYDIRGFPRLFVIKNGKLLYYHSGYSASIEKDVSKVLDKALGR